MAAYAPTTTRVCRVLIGLAVLWGLLGLSGRETGAFDDESARATLRRVEGVQVVVERFAPDVERAGLTRQQLQTDVELQLRQAGIPVLTHEERHAMPGAPWLYIHVNVVLSPDVRLVPYHIRVELRQGAILQTYLYQADVSTWNAGETGVIGKTQLASLRPYVRDRVDEFITAYRSVHPRPIDSGEQQ
jgi:hypothetical protein